jgi:hypothetical protein
MDIGLQKRHSDFTQTVRDVFFGQLPVTFQLLKGCTKLVA